jgi:hypothetical protein
MAIDKKLIDQLLTDYKKPEDIIGENGLLKELTKAILERALQAEMTDHLGYEKHDPAGHHRGNTHNGKSQKTLKGEFGKLGLETPRDRQATFDPKIVAKGQTRWTGFDDKIISMYVRGMTTREIQGHLEEIYGIEVSPTLISNVTDAVIEEVKLWQNRPLEKLYPIVYLDALMVKVRDEGHIQNKAIYVVLGVNLEGQKEVLGLWVAQSEGAKFWLQVLTELQNRGVKDILIACVDGLKGFPEAIEAIYPRTEVRLCIGPESLRRAALQRPSRQAKRRGLQRAAGEQPENARGVGPDRMCCRRSGGSGGDARVVADETSIAKSVKQARVHGGWSHARVRRERERIRTTVVSQEGGVDVQVIGVGRTVACIKPTGVDSAVPVHSDSREKVITRELVVDHTRGAKSSRAGAVTGTGDKVHLRCAVAVGLSAVNDVHVAARITRGSRTNRKSRKTVDAITGYAAGAAGKIKITKG